MFVKQRCPSPERCTLVRRSAEQYAVIRTELPKVSLSHDHPDVIHARIRQLTHEGTG